MDDIWASFYVLSKGFKVVYNKASVFQKRNEHDLTKDMLKEFIGYVRGINILDYQEDLQTMVVFGSLVQK